MNRLRMGKGWRLIGAIVACASLIHPVARAADAIESSSEAVLFALTLLGTPYRYGGSRPATGFDCSGFVRFVFGQTSNLDLPRRTQDMRHVGTRLPIDSVQPGDLLFFNTLGRPWSHVAIAIGDGQFVHAPARGGRVRVERLTDPYWTQRFNGARRIRGPAPTVEPLPPPPASIFDDPRVTP